MKKQIFIATLGACGCMLSVWISYNSYLNVTASALILIASVFTLAYGFQLIDNKIKFK